MAGIQKKCQLINLVKYWDVATITKKGWGYNSILQSIIKATGLSGGSTAPL